MKVIRNDLIPDNFKDIKPGDSFVIYGEQDIYIKTSYVYSDTSGVCLSNCINIETGIPKKLDSSADVYPVKAKIVIERE